MEEGKLIPVGEAARRLGVCAATVRRMSERGVLDSIRTAGGHRRFRVSQVDLLTQSPPARASEVSEADARPPEVPALPSPRPETPPARTTEHIVPSISADEPREGQSLSGIDISPGRPNWEAEIKKRQDAEEQRLLQLKLLVPGLIPFGIPDLWRARVLRRMERVLTAANFPNSLPLWDARTLLVAEVEDELADYRDELAAAEEAREREGELSALVSHGQHYAKKIAGHLGRSQRRDLKDEFAGIFEEQIEPDWTRTDVEDLVDELLGKV